VACVPAIEIRPLEENNQLQAAKSFIQRLDEFHFLIFISQNAVGFAFDWIEDFWPQFPLGVQCLAIGEKTGEALALRLAAFLLAVDQHAYGASMNSEELLLIEALQNVRDKKILIFRGVGGRTKLYDELSRRGADVQHCELYHRHLPENSLARLIEKKLNADHDIVTIFSGESLANFHLLLSQADVGQWQKMSLVVPSQRVGAQARALGFERVCVALNATEEQMWIALTRMLDIR